MNSHKVLICFILLTIAIVMSGCQPCQQMIGITHVNLIPMTSEKVIPNQTVLVSGTEIIAMGDSDVMPIPARARIINGFGDFLIPGLADMHMHTRADWENRDIWPVHPLQLYLANGVTTIRDFAPYGSPITYALEWRDEIQHRMRFGPTIYTSGILLYTSPLDDPAGLVRKNHELGFDFLKLYSYLSEDDFHQTVSQGKALGMYTAGHIPYAVGLEKALYEGMDEIAHVEELLYEFIHFDRNQQLAPNEWSNYLGASAIHQFDPSSRSLWVDFQEENQNTLDRIAHRLQIGQVPVCTTMVIDDIIQLKLFHQDVFLERPENVFFEKGYLEGYQRGEEKHQVQCLGLEAMCAFKYEIDRWILEGLHDGKVLLVLGTDSGTGGMGIIPGYSIHDELRILVENGFTPYEALLTGTVNAAIVVDKMNGDGNFGSIEVGNRADLILVNENPLENIAVLRSPVGVMAAGRWFSSEALNLLIETSDSCIVKE